MNRRDFLARSSAALAAGTAALPVLAEAGTAAPAAASAPLSNPAERDAAFRARLARDRRMLGWRSAPTGGLSQQPRLEGRWPAGLKGSFYRNGPGLHDRAGQRYGHWFDGDGLIQHWQLDDSGAARFQARFVGTPKFQTEQEAGRFLYPAGGGGMASERAMSGPDTINPANTNLLTLADGGLWALWEGGSASRVDAGTLDFGGFVTLARELRGAPFSAHPRKGADGRIWNLGSMGTQLALYRLSPTGGLEASRMHTIAPTGMVHDFILTSRSVVVVLPSTRLGDGDGFFARVRPAPAEPIQVLVFDRETLALTRRAELPAGYVFHFGNGWEEADGTIRFDMVHSANTDQVQHLRAPMQGEMPPDDQSRSLLVTIAPSGATSLARLVAEVEFPTINPRRTTTRNRYLYMAARDGADADWFDAVAKVDLERGGVTHARYGRGWMAEEHLFVPRPGATREDDGWLVGTALHLPGARTALTVFDATRPSEGPLARLWLDTALPLAFHSQFVAGA